MKKFTLILLLLPFLTFCFGQDSGRFKTTTYNANVDSVAEALVAMAMNNATVKASMYTASQFKYQYKASKTAWLNNIAIQGNLNEYSFTNTQVPSGTTGNSTVSEQNTQYPKYNFGVIIPMGIFFSTPKQVKSDYYHYLWAQEQVNVERQNLRREVLINYHDYLTYKQEVAEHQQLLNDWKIIHGKNEQKFSKGEITLEAFYNSTKTYTDELNKQEGLENSLKASSAKLEAEIGMNIEDALTQIANAQPK